MVKKDNKTKVKKIKESKIKYQGSETANEIKKYIIVLVSIIAVFIGLYFLTGKLIVKDLVEETDDTKVEISYTEIVMGSLLNRPEEKYYVVAYNTKTDENGLAYTIASYRGKTTKETVYSVDLSNKFNSSYYEKDYSSTEIPTSLDNLKVGDYTLFTIEKGIITKVVNGFENVEKFFK